MSILPLRLLGLSDSNPELSRRVGLLMDHLSDMGEAEKKVWEVSREQCDRKLFWEEGVKCSLAQDFFYPCRFDKRIQSDSS
jgi:hypothetical protein